MMLLYIGAITFISSFVLTYLVRRYALSKGLQDEPNARSSHINLTPHGGGLAIVVSFIGSILIGYYFNFFEVDIVFLVIFCGGAIAAIGFYDDHKPLGVRVRIAIQFICASTALGILGGLPDLSIGTFHIEWSYSGYLLGVLFLVWMTNLYNFIDGIDGYSSIEAVTASSSMAIILLVFTPFESLWNINGLLVTSVLGFLVWNFPKAKIFMGDVGSYFLGFILGIIMLKSWNQSTELIFSWLILLAVFITDATYTLISRALRGDKFYEAHRSHAYQIASRRLNSHIKVSVLLMVINIFMLFPVAFVVMEKMLSPVAGLALAYIPLIIMQAYLGAGKTEIE